MMTITLIIIFIIIAVVAFSQFSRKSFIRAVFNELNAKPLSISIRLFYYALLAGLSVVTPYIVTVLCIIATGDRIEGMKLGVIPGLATVHIIFGLIYLRNKIIQKLFLTVVLTALAFALVWFSLINELISTGWDIYGFWDLSVNNFIAGLIIWETYFQVAKRVSRTAKIA
jgi:hypothetical protein